MENKNVAINEEKECTCEATKAELEAVKKQLEEALNLNKQYEEAYRDLVARYNRLRSMLDNTIEYSLGAK